MEEVPMDSTAALGLTEKDLFLKLKIVGPNGEQGDFEFPIRFTVDKIKSLIFEKMEELKSLKAKDYCLALNENDKLEVEFLKFIRSSPKIEDIVSKQEVVVLYILPKVTNSGSFLGLGANRRVTQLSPPNPSTRSLAGGMKSVLSESPSSPNPNSQSPQLQRATQAHPPLPHSASLSGAEKSVIRMSVEKGGLKHSHTKSKSRDIHLNELSHVLKEVSNEKETSAPSSPANRPTTPKEDKSSKEKEKEKEKEKNRGRTVSSNNLTGSPPTERSSPSSSPRPSSKKFFSTRFLSKKDKGGTEDLVEEPSNSKITQSSPPPDSSAQDDEDDGNNEEDVNLSEVKVVNIPHQNQPTLRSRRPTVSSKINVRDYKDKLSEVVLTSGLDTFSLEQPSATNDIEEEIFIENEDKNEPYYRINFFGQDHINLCAVHDTIGPVIVSAKKYEDGKTILALERTKKGDSRHKIVLPKKSKKLLTAKQVIQLLYPEQHSGFKDIRQIKDPNCSKELETYERRQLISSYKFGLLYVAPGQVKEEDMFYNCQCSPAWEEFLEFLGDKVPLKGWTKYRAGLDIKTDTTGTHSLYTVFNKFEVMYHVAPMLPFYPNDPQQLERKRHLGNDIVVIIFIDGNTPFVVDNTIKSEFNHVYCIVQKLPTGTEKTHYKVTFAKKDGVPGYGPSIPKDQIFEKNEDFRNWLMIKLINSERLSYMAPGFRIAIERTKTQLLTELVNGFDRK